MKTFVLILMGLGVMILLASCSGKIKSYADENLNKRELEKFANEYSGFYILNEKFRDEIIQREKERKEYWSNRSNQIDEEKERILRTLFTEEELQIARDYEEWDKSNILYRTYFKITKKEEEEHFERVLKVFVKVKKKRDKILQDLEDNKYPNLVDEKFPRVLSNGYEYKTNSFSMREYSNEIPQEYINLFKELLGEAYNVAGIMIGECYYDKKGARIPISFSVSFPFYYYEYGIYGDEGAGVRFREQINSKYYVDRKLYLKNNKFVERKE